MFGFLPDVVGDIFILISFVVGPGGVIWLLLAQKGANKKLEVDELGVRGSLTVDQFNAALPAYKDLLDRSNKERDAALAVAKDYKTTLESYKQELDDVKEDLGEMRSLVKKMVDDGRVILSPEEYRILENTRPKPFRPATS